MLRFSRVFFRFLAYTHFQNKDSALRFECTHENVAGVPTICHPERGEGAYAIWIAENMNSGMLLSAKAADIGAPPARSAHTIRKTTAVRAAEWRL